MKQETVIKLKKNVIHTGICNMTNINWIFDTDTDRRVINAAKRLAESDAEGTPIHISHTDGDSEAYELTIMPDGVKIKSGGAAGAFYAIATLKMLIKSNNGKVQCRSVYDYPDMKYRGFYHDVTRGRIPTLETLKKLVDTMSDYKLNSLQLYVEHTIDFDEYAHCREELGCLTSDEIKELDAYCHDRFIDLVPSISTFGHLYHLLQSDRYNHLCELKSYEPNTHYWCERMGHHTINPTIPESFELISGIIDKYSALYTSNYFNICCDETFDLANGVNKGKDKGRLYVDFVNKIISHLEAKGKTVMMWGDIILQHKEYISEISDDVVFLNWDYEETPDENKAKAFKDKNQIVCPGTTSWYGFTERVELEESNIVTLAKQGYENSAFGILNTNWGDVGNLAVINMAMYGMILGAAIGWDKTTTADAEFRKLVSEYYYGNSAAIDLVAEFGGAKTPTNWTKLMIGDNRSFDFTKDECDEYMNRCKAVLEKVIASDFKTEEIKMDFIIATEGYMLLTKWYAKSREYDITCDVDFSKWLEQYIAQWNKTSKQSELAEHIKVFSEFNNKYC